MTWNRHTSDVETITVEILLESPDGLTSEELTNEIRRRDPKHLQGKTPERSLYSIIYRREKRRIARGHNPLILLTKNKQGKLVYTLPESIPDNVGKKILSS